MLYWSKYIYHIVMLTEIYCRFTIIDYTTYSFLSLECVYIFLADPVFVTESNMCNFWHISRFKHTFAILTISFSINAYVTLILYIYILFIYLFIYLFTDFRENSKPPSTDLRTVPYTFTKFFNVQIWYRLKPIKTVWFLTFRGPCIVIYNKMH